MQSFISLPSLNTVCERVFCKVGVTLFLSLSLVSECINLTSSCISQCGAMLSTM